MAGRGAALAGFAALLAAAPACTKTECGEGTIERDDECVPADGVTPETISCGPGTEYRASDGACIPILPPTQCGPNTVPEVDENGVTLCVGVGGGSCSDPIACPQPDGAQGTVCGQILDAETNQPLIEGDGSDTSACNPKQPAAEGPCSLELRAYDALFFVTTPNPQQLPADELTIDRCGRFRVVNVEVPGTAIVAITTEDNTNGSTDVIAHSGIAQRLAPGGRVTGRGILALRHTTDEAWTQSAGNPFGGQTFSERGVAMVTYRYQRTPQVGVQATVGSNVRANDDFYFPADAEERAVIDPAAGATGANGTALIVNIQNIEQVAGEGAEPGTCTWSTELAGSPANTVFVADRIPVDGDLQECE